MTKTSPIRILHEVAGLGSGGVETFLMNVYRNIDLTKVQFDFILSHDWKNNLYEDEIKSLGGKIFYLPEGYRQFLSFYKFLKSHPEYKIVHSHRGSFGSFYLFTAMLAGIKHRIVHAHTSSALHRFKAISVILLRPFLKLVSTKRYSCGLDAGKWIYGRSDFEVLNNSIDLSSFQHFEQRSAIRNKLGIKEDEILFGHVGRFSPEKNHSFLVKVFEAILKKQDKSKLLFIGSGSLKSDIEQQIVDLGLRDSVIFLQNRNDVNELLVGMDLVIFPSLFEGFSFAMLEMQAASLRILASDTIPPEINITGEVFFKSLNDSVEDWADTALSLVEYDRKEVNIKTLNEMGYDIKGNAGKLEQFYLNCVSGHK